MLVKVKDKNHLVRDSLSGAIINTNETEYKRAVAASLLARQKEERMSAMEEDISSLKEDITDIKRLLQNFMEKY